MQVDGNEVLADGGAQSEMMRATSSSNVWRKSV
jgi:hypothetical protein